MYSDFFLRFATEAEADSVLYTEQNADTYRTQNFQNIDPLGHVAGEDGWLVNVRVVLGLEDFSSLVPFAIQPPPESPLREWVGGMFPFVASS